MYSVRIQPRRQGLFAISNKRRDLIGEGLMGRGQQGGNVATTLLKEAAIAALPIIASYAIPKAVEYIKTKTKKQPRKPRKTGGPLKQKQITSISSRSKNVLDQIVKEGRGMNYF